MNYVIIPQMESDPRNQIIDMGNQVIPFVTFMHIYHLNHTWHIWYDFLRHVIGWRALLKWNTIWWAQHDSAVEECCDRRYQGQGQVITCHSIHRITCPCPSCLLHAQDCLIIVITDATRDNIMTRIRFWHYWLLWGECTGVDYHANVHNENIDAPCCHLGMIYSYSMKMMITSLASTTIKYQWIQRFTNYHWATFY